MILALLLLSACSQASVKSVNQSINAEVIEQQADESALAENYEIGMAALKENDFIKAAEYLEKAGTYQDSEQQYAYAMAMRCTGEACKLYPTLQWFEKAGDIGKAPQSATFLRDLLSQIEGMWRDGSGREFASIITIDSKGILIRKDTKEIIKDAAKADDGYEFPYDIYVMLSYYGLEENVSLNALCVGHSSTDILESDKSLMANLSVDEEADANRLILERSSGKDYYTKITEEKLKHELVEVQQQIDIDLLAEHLTDYKWVPLEEQTNIFLNGGKWTVDRWNYVDVLEFKEDGSVEITKEDGTVYSSEWMIRDDGVMLYSKKSTGEWTYELKLKDYYDGQFIWTEFLLNNSRAHWNIATPEHKPDRQVLYEDRGYEFYNELWSMPTLESVYDNVTCYKTEEKYSRNQATQFLYYYQLPSNLDSAMEVFDGYHALLTEYFDVEKDEMECLHVSLNTLGRAAVKAGKDNEVGYYMIIGITEPE